MVKAFAFWVILVNLCLRVEQRPPGRGEQAFVVVLGGRRVGARRRRVHGGDRPWSLGAGTGAATVRREARGVDRHRSVRPRTQETQSACWRMSRVGVRMSR